jgi:hypothetical protein
METISAVPYTALRARGPVDVTGRLDTPDWLAAPRSPGFVDMATGRPALLETQAAVLWDDESLHIGFWAQEPFPEARLTERDSLIFTENDVEVFVDGGDCYYELEMNALGTVYEVLFIWRDAHKPGSRFDTADLHPMTREAYSFGGDYDRRPESFWRGTHPRGSRWAYLDWDLPGLRTAVRVDGTLNDRSVRSRGWTAQIALPWRSLRLMADGRSLPPRDGDLWRLFFGRFQQIEIADTQVQAAWCWTPHGVYDTHMPERFTSVVFSTRTAGGR